jgi:murein DD-endopeptidase MepM/ murein hydrolase activator NlpD
MKKAAARHAARSPRARGRVGRKLAAFFLVSLIACVALPPFAWPLRGRVSSGFFLRHRPDSRLPLAFELHKGLDIAAPEGAPVRASAPGIVTEAGYSPELGNYVRLRHLFGFRTTYGHLSRVDVAPGKIVVLRGLAKLGSVGSTGRSTGPHLHFSLAAGELLLPPRLFLAFHSLRLKVAGF